MMKNYFIDGYFPIEEKSEKLILDVSSNKRIKYFLDDLQIGTPISYVVRKSYEIRGWENDDTKKYTISKVKNMFEVNYVCDEGSVERILVLPFRKGFEWTYIDHYPEDETTKCRISEKENIMIGGNIIENCFKLEYTKNKHSKPFLVEWYAAGIGLVKFVEVYSSHDDQYEIIKYKSGDGKTECSFFDL